MLSLRSTKPFPALIDTQEQSMSCHALPTPSLAVTRFKTKQKSKKALGLGLRQIITPSHALAHNVTQREQGQGKNG